MPAFRASVLSALAASSGIRGSLAAVRDLPGRLTAGECSEDSVPDGETYFLPENQVHVESNATVADLFTLAYGDSFKVVISRVSKEQYVLTQCGQAQPTDEAIEAVAPLGTNYTRKHFTVPVQSAYPSSTTHQGFLELLEVQDRVPYVSMWSTGACWQKAVGCSATLDSNTTIADQQKAALDVVFMSCTDSTSCANVQGTPNGVHVPASQDSGLLETAEYVKFFAAFFNKEPKAKEVYMEAETAMANALHGVSDRPTVAWITARGPPWYGDEYVISLASYKMEMASMAGGTNLEGDMLANLSGVVVSDAVWGHPDAGKNYVFNRTDPTTAQSFFTALANVDAVIDESYKPDHAGYTFEAFLEHFGIANTSTLPFVTEEMVLRKDGTLSPTGGEDWFESRLSNPAAAVLGLTRVLHAANKPNKYFRNIGIGELPVTVSSTDCQVTLPQCDANAFPEAIDTLGNPGGATTTVAGNATTTEGPQLGGGNATTTEGDDKESSGAFAPTASLIAGSLALGLFLQQ